MLKEGPPGGNSAESEGGVSMSPAVHSTGSSVPRAERAGLGLMSWSLTKSMEGSV